MKITLVDYTENPEEKIASYAAICYGSKTDEVSNAKRIKHLVDVKHLATLRFASATFKIEGISRACSHQLVRHPHLSYLQESQRYRNQTGTNFIIPPGIGKYGDSTMVSVFTDALVAYQKLIDMGVRKEDARFVLPEATSTSLYITGNFQAFYDMLSKRLGSSAQWEVKQVAESMLTQLLEIAPNVFRGLDNER